MVKMTMGIKNDWQFPFSFSWISDAQRILGYSVSETIWSRTQVLQLTANPRWSPSWIKTYRWPQWSRNTARLRGANPKKKWKRVNYYYFKLLTVVVVYYSSVWSWHINYYVELRCCQNKILKHWLWVLDLEKAVYGL